MKKLKESFETHEELNPKLWQNNKLIKKVRNKIFEIIDLFKQDCDLSIDVVDAQIVGSNASFNYTENSDLDLHLIVNFDLLDSSDEVAQAFFKLQKSNFKNNYDIKIYDIPVEVYVEDINSGVCSNGIYSVYKDDWVKFPKKIDTKTYNLQNQVSRWVELIDLVLQEGNEDIITQTINKLYMIRKNAIAMDGEYSKGNQLFKDIRDTGKIKELKQSLKDIKSQNLTLEDLNYYDEE